MTLVTHVYPVQHHFPEFALAPLTFNKHIFFYHSMIWCTLSIAFNNKQVQRNEMNENMHAASFLRQAPSSLSTTPARSSNLFLHTGFLQEQHNTSVALQTFVYTSTAGWRPSNHRCLNLDVQSFKHIVRQITIKQTAIFSRYNLRVQ